MQWEEMTVEMKGLLTQMSVDLEKALKGNKTAAQRVRKSSIVFSKVAKEFRKASLQAEKKKA